MTKNQTSNKISNRYILFLGLPDTVKSELSQAIASPHITLKYDEKFTLSESELINIIAKFTLKTPPFNVKINSIKINSGPLGYNVHFPLFPKKTFARLTKSISKILEPHIDPKSKDAYTSTHWEQSDKYYPHVSIKGSSDLNLANKYYKDAVRKYGGGKISFTAKQITLAKMVDGKWERVKSFKLNQLS